jgi:DNA-binding NtrC family response regulator
MKKAASRARIAAMQVTERADGGACSSTKSPKCRWGMQTHLLRVLEAGMLLRVGAEREIPVSARLVAATNRDPAQAVRDGVLREDLYFRLRVFPLDLPPLRERVGDIPLLTGHFLAELNARNDTRKGFSPEALQKLGQYQWPGNVRELKHTIQRAYIMAESDLVQVPDRFDEEVPLHIDGLAVGRSIADVEKDLILSTLEHFGGDKKQTAATLGVSIKTLYNRLKSYESAN